MGYDLFVITTHIAIQNRHEWYNHVGKFTEIYTVTFGKYEVFSVPFEKTEFKVLKTATQNKDTIALTDIYHHCKH